MTDLSSLIERLEKAEGPSRYDDCHLWVIAKGGDARMRVCDSSTKDFVWERGIDGMWVRGVVKFSSVPKYTSSIDAAVSLAERVLPGWAWKVGTCCVSDDAWLAPERGERIVIDDETASMARAALKTKGVPE